MPSEVRNASQTGAAGVPADDIGNEHIELLRALLAGDGAGAEAIMRRHVIGFEREIRKVLLEG